MANKEKRKVIKGFFLEFKEFAIRGKAIDLAVGVVIGAAFTNIVNAIVSSIIMPILTVLTLTEDLAEMNFKIFGAYFKFGFLAQAIINFVITAFIIFVIVKILNKLHPTTPEDEAVKKDDEILSELKKINQNLEKLNN